MAMVVCLFLSYKGVHQLWKCPSHPAALALLLSPHCAAAGPLVLVPICRTDTKVLCKPRSTCSLSLCMIWMAQEMVLEAVDSEYLLSPTTCFCGLWDAEKQMASWKWHSFSGRLSDVVANATHCSGWARWTQSGRECCAPDPCPTLPETLSHVLFPAQHRYLIWSRIHWLRNALDPAVMAWDWWAWEGVGYRSAETWQVARKWKGIKPL